MPDPENPTSPDSAARRERLKQVLRSRVAHERVDTEAVPQQNRDLTRFTDFEKFPGVVELTQRTTALEALGLKNPFFTVSSGIARGTININGRCYANFSNYNYLDLCGDPRVSAASKRAIDQYGTSVSASRIASGERTLHHELERALADFIGCEDCVAMVSGHATNVTVIGQILGPKDLIVYDALIHNSVVEGAALSGARRIAFSHNDCRSLDAILSENRTRYERVLVVIEGVYSMDGDIPDLPAVIDIKNRHHALLMVDEAHSLGVLGQTGRGVGEHFGCRPDDVDIWMGTMSKTLASCGGYIAGSGHLVEYLRYSAPGFLFSVGISPANTAAALAALRILEGEPERIQRLKDNSKRFLQRAQAAELDTGFSDETAVVPVITGDSRKAVALSNALAREGINVQPVLYPAVEESAARLRFFLSSAHENQQIDHAIDVTATQCRNLGILQ